MVTDVDTLIRRVSNWGRWGAGDQLGTLNFVTDAVRASASDLITTGQAFSLAIDFGPDAPQPAGSDRMNPRRFMSSLPANGEKEGTADDVLVMSTHAATHWDSLAHIFHNGRMYNDISAEQVGPAGAARNDIASLRAGVTGRGILADVAAFKGVDALKPAYEITGRDLDDCLEAQRVEVQPGDFLLIRTGRLGVVRQIGAWHTFVDAPEPGVGLDATAWLWEHETAAVGCDTWAVEVLPSRASGYGYPVHAVAIAHMGLLLGEMFDLDALAASCRADRRYSFFFVGAPLPLLGGLGSPINPMAIK